MFYHIETEERSAGGRSGTVYTLKHAGGAAEAEVWPAHGFNCLRWRVNTGEGLRDLLYASPEWDSNPVPSRSGVPILYPFPNRIRDGKYSFGWKNYQLPLNDSTKKNAIHGYAPRHPWRVFGYKVEDNSAWVHGDFQTSVDAPETAAFWPSDSIFSVVYRLSAHALRLEMSVRNFGDSPLPFGIGLHPYFRFPCDDQTIDRCKLLAPARSIWECVENLPTGERKPVADGYNWNSARVIGPTLLDTLYTDLGAIEERADGLLLRAALGHTEFPGAIQVWTSKDFRESVLFTPQHRQAVCIEPYTCATDAINLTERGVDAGWKVLPQGEKWTGVVEFRWDPNYDC
ncbi:MAG: aldose 1-epimerase [Planctomycetes bacterium]|nr:aldose 1-epimerase [Planctomycetota bacterium]